MAVFQNNQRSSPGKDFELNRRQFLASTSIALATASLGLSNTPDSQVPANHESFTRQQPSRSLAELQIDYPDFDSYLCQVLDDAGLHGSKDFNLSEALFYFAHDCSTQDLCPAFEFDALQLNFYEITNAIGSELAKQYPWIVDSDREEIRGRSLQTKIAVLESLNEMFYSVFSVNSNQNPRGEVTTISELMEVQGGVCEDLTGAYCALIQILKQGGIDLPIYPLLAPNHVLVGWDDRPHQEVVSKPEDPALYVELTTVGGAVLESPLTYYVQQLVSREAKGYLTAFPLEAALSSELRNRAVAYRNSNSRDKYETARREMEAALELAPSADKYMALYEILIVMEGDYDQEELDALNQAIALDPSARKPAVSLANWNFEKGLFRESEQQEKLTSFHRALEELYKARLRPLMFFEKIGMFETNDAAQTEAIFYLEARIARECYAVSGEEFYYHQAILAATSCITSKADESEGNWLVSRRMLAYNLRANLHWQHFQDNVEDLNCLEMARQDWLELGNYSSRFGYGERTGSRAFENAARISISLYKISSDRKEYYLQEAEQAYHEAWSVSSEEESCRYWAAKGMILTLQGKTHEGLEIFNEVLEETESGSAAYLIALLWRGATQTEQGRTKAAKRDFSEAVKWYRKSYQARDLQKLVMDTLLLHPKNPVRKTSEFLGMLQLRPKAAALFDSILSKT